MKARIFIIMMFFLFFPAFSNVSFYSSGRGGMLYPLRSKDLIMTAETIDIDVYRGSALNSKSYKAFHYYTEFKCSYTYKNTGDDQEILLGFPVNYGEDYEPYGTFIKYYDPMFTDFHVKADGKAADYKIYIHGFNPDLKELDYEEVYGFPVFVKKGAVFNVEVFYTVVQEHYTSIYEARDVYYILKSAKTFKEPIKQADIMVTFHFPADFEIKSEPGTHSIHVSKENPFTAITWNLTNLTPQADISISYDSGKEEIGDLSKLIQQLNAEESISAYFSLTTALNFGKEKLAGKITKELNNTLREFYKQYLSNPEISDTLAGFIIGDIDKNPARSPDTLLVKKVRDRIRTAAARFYQKEKETAESVWEILKSEPMNRVYMENAYYYTSRIYMIALFSKYFSFKDDPINNLVKSNYYMTELAALMDKNKTRFFEIKDTCSASCISAFESLLTEKKDNTGEIAEFINTYGYDKEFRNELEIIDFYAYYQKRIEELTWLIRDQKNKNEAAFVLTKLLKSLFNQLDFKKKYTTYYKNLTELRKHLFDKEIRNTIRMGYYTLGNYYFKNQFDKSIYFYKLALAYCTFSPLFDFLVLTPGISYGYLNWTELNSDLLPAEDMQLLKNIMGKSAPWWYDLEYPEKITAEDIIKLYTPGRIIKLNLNYWPQEAADRAPCYYIAYNIACAYSRLGKSDDALEWLKIAFRLKNDLVNMAKTDKDLELVRINRRTDFDRLIQQKN